MEKERKKMNKDAGSVKRGIVAQAVTGKKERKNHTRFASQFRFAKSLFHSKLTLHIYL